MENTINYKDLIIKNPWIIEKNQKAILSPDSDGLLCGLFMSNFLNWKIVGFYDGKILLLENNIKAEDCVFLDMEIYRPNIRSIGHHMVLFNKNRFPETWGNFKNCIQPNNIRGYDAYHNFRLKYPLATIHLLLPIVSQMKKIDIIKDAICPLLYTDGTFKNLLNFPENCISWLNFLGGDRKDNPLYEIFYNDHYNVSDLMLALNNFFGKLSKIGKGADKIKVSNSKGEFVNIIEKGTTYDIANDQRNKTERFLGMLSKLTGWNYKTEEWTWTGFNKLKFTKDNIKPSNARFHEMLDKKPLSWAMTSSLAIEYTLEHPDTLS